MVLRKRSLSLSSPPPVYQTSFHVVMINETPPTSNSTLKKKALRLLMIL